MRNFISYNELSRTRVSQNVKQAKWLPKGRTDGVRR